MYFTKEDYQKIVQYLKENGYRDSELPIADTLNADDLVAIVQNDTSKRVTIDRLMDELLPYLDDQVIETKHIKDGAITTVKIADENVTTAKIADLNVTTEKIANENVTIEKMAARSVGTDNLVDQSVTKYKIKDGDIELGKLSKALRDTIKAATGVPEDLAEDIDKLMKKTFPLTTSYTIVPTALQEKGSGDVEVTLKDFTAIVDGVAVQVTRKIINGVVVDEATYTETISDTKSYEVTIEAEGRSNTTTKTVTFVYPIYIFFNANSDYTAITSLTGKQSLATSLNISKKVFTNTGTTDEYLWIVSSYTPTSVQSVTGFTFDIPGSVRGSKNNLNYWRSNDALATGDWTLTIK